MATKKPTKTPDKIRREIQLQQITDASSSLSALSGELNKQQKTLDLLQSVSAGLYDEIDKLTKKSPVDQISPLVLKQVNDVIRESKELAADDPFMKRYAEFIPAGDNPEHRDVVVVLRQIRQGLDRLSLILKLKKETTAQLLSDAKGIRVALLFTFQGEKSVTISNLTYNNVSVSNYWIQNYEFNFALLDRTDISTHFKLPE